jgi:hypothetical protein
MLAIRPCLSWKLSLLENGNGCLSEWHEVALCGCWIVYENCLLHHDMFAVQAALLLYIRCLQ